MKAKVLNSYTCSLWWMPPSLEKEMTEKLPESTHADYRYHPRIASPAIFPRIFKSTGLCLETSSRYTPSECCSPWKQVNICKSNRPEQTSCLYRILRCDFLINL